MSTQYSIETILTRVIKLSKLTKELSAMCMHCSCLDLFLTPPYTPLTDTPARSLKEAKYSGADRLHDSSRSMATGQRAHLKKWVNVTSRRDLQIATEQLFFTGVIQLKEDLVYRMLTNLTGCIRQGL